MKASDAPGRESYQTSGKVTWGRFGPLAIAAWAVSFGLAALLYVLLLHGLYYMIIVPLLAALVVAGMLLLVIHFGRCRSRFVGGCVGGIAGVVLYLGQFYIGMVHELGAEYAHRLDVLPHYIAMRMQTDTTGDIGNDKPESEEDRERRASDQIGNWVTFTFEFGFVLLFTVGAAVMRARRAYCERCNHWMKQQVATFAPGRGSAFVRAMQQDSLPAFAALAGTPVATVNVNTPYTAVSVEYCPPGEGKGSECPVYLSVKEVRKGGGGGNLGLFETSTGKMLLHRVELAREEAAALSPKFSDLEQIAGKPPPLLATQPPTDTLLPAPGEAAQFIPVPPPFGSRALSRRHAVLSNVVGMMVLVGLLGGIGLAILGGALVLAEGVTHLAAKALGALLILLGLALFAGFAVVGLSNPSVLANRYLYRVLRRELARRPALLTDPDAPGVWFLEVVPRANRNRVMLETATDVGFLTVDVERGEVLFDGDAECYRVPGSAIISCALEEYSISQGSGQTSTRYGVMLRAHDGTTVREVPFEIRWIAWRLTPNRRLEGAIALRDQILSIRPPPSPPPLPASNP
jgi:hypothetical protein